MTKPRSVPTMLSDLFDAERRVRQLHAELRSAEPELLLAGLLGAIEQAQQLDADAAEPQLVCVARLLGELDTETAVDALIDVLGCAHAGARAEAGEQLQGLCFDCFAEVAAGVERALERLPGDSLALVELPYLLSEIGQGEVLQLLGTMLEHPNANVVAAAIEALVEQGDPAAIPLCAELRGDRRTSVLGDEEGEHFQATVGELASDAVELLSLANQRQPAGGEP